MRQRLHKINKYLLEHYPTTWNTKIVWILLVSLLVHILFFIIGYFSHYNPTSLHYSNAVDDFFRNGLVYISVLISVLILVVWLVSMFRNNAFKNFYPVSRPQLFSQFVHYFIIVLVSTSFYWSYMLGFRTFINTAYSDAEMKKNIELINKSAAFLSQDYIGYDLSERRYPKVFSKLYCETDPKKIIRSEKYFTNNQRSYQFFEIYAKAATEKNDHQQWLIPQPERGANTRIAYTHQVGDSLVFFFQKRVVDVSNDIETLNLSYYNYSTLFHTSISNGSEETIPNFESTPSNLSRGNAQSEKARFEINKSVAHLLDAKNPKVIEQLLEEFLKLSKKYQIKTNLNAQDWTKLVYHPDTFEVKNFIKRDKMHNAFSPSSADYVEEEALKPTYSNVADSDSAIIQQGETQQEFYENNTTNFYYESQRLKDLLNNVEVIKSNRYFTETAHLFLWISFFISMIIFSFRVTSLRTLLFSFVSVGVLILLVTLVGALSDSLVAGNYIAYIVTSFILLLISSILALAIFGHKVVSKFINSIALVISMNFMLLIPLCILGIITLIQTERCRSKLKINELASNCKGILDYYTTETYSLLFLVAGFLGIYLFIPIIRKWRARPE